MADRCLLSVHAHPDDEASKGAPTVALYKVEGVRSVLVTCTGGEEGDILNPAMDRPEVRADLHGVRLRELEAAAAIIGYDEVVLLGYRDSGMPGSEANARPDAFANADLDEAVDRLVSIIRRERPQVILTYPDDQDGYPHPDHLRVHDISLPAWERGGRPGVQARVGRGLHPAEALLLGLVPGTGAGHPREVHRDGPRLALLARVVRAAEPRPPHHHLDRHQRHLRGAGRGAEGPRHPGRSHVAVLVRAPARGRPHGPSLRGVHPRLQPGRHRSCPRPICSPGSTEPDVDRPDEPARVGADPPRRDPARRSGPAAGRPRRADVVRRPADLRRRPSAGCRSHLAVPGRASHGSTGRPAAVASRRRRWRR